MSEYIQITKQKRIDVGNPLTLTTRVIGLSEAIDECVRFSDVKDPEQIRQALMAGNPIYTNFHIYRR